MKKYSILFLSIFLLFSCASIEKKLTETSCPELFISKEHKDYFSADKDNISGEMSYIATINNYKLKCQKSERNAIFSILDILFVVTPLKNVGRLLPSRFSERLSSLINVENGELLILTQIDLLDENKSDFKMGFEYKLNHLAQPLYFRGGSKIINNNDFIGPKSIYNFTFGFGIPIKLENFNLVFDYAIDPGLMDQGISHIISFSFLN
mgnify:CR=1 FL=1